MILRWKLLVLILLGCLTRIGYCNLPPVFTQDMNNIALSEATPVGWIVYNLEGYDPEGGEVSFGLVGSDNFAVNPKTGEVKVVKPLDREHKDTLSFLVTIKDKVNPAGGESEFDNLVEVPIKVIIVDENDNAPEFQYVPYETEVLENAPLGTRVFNSISVTDKDLVGETLNISCLSSKNLLIKTSIPKQQFASAEPCSKFSIEVLESNQDHLRAAVILKGKLDYNEQMIYHLLLAVTDGTHETKTSMEIRVVDVQNRPPIFQGSLTSVIDEDSLVGTLVMTVQAKDGDHGQPRKIVYDLSNNPMGYFSLDSKSGELRTAKPLDREALADATGLVTLSVRAREIIDGRPGNDNTTTSVTQASITIRDVNDSPPLFDRRDYFVSLAENTPVGTPLPTEINVKDPDVGQNAIFALRLEDISGVLDVEPKLVSGSSKVTIRVANGTLDYENPNHRKFIVLIIAEETETSQRLSSTASLIVTLTDTNDNRPSFQEDSYSFSVSEMATSGHTIATVTAKDLDSGRFGSDGIRYLLSGTGAELFDVDERTGTISVAECPKLQRIKRETDELINKAKNVNLTIVGRTGVIDIDNTEITTTDNFLPTTQEQITFRPYFHSDEDYMVLNVDEEDVTTISPDFLEQRLREVYVNGDESNQHSLERGNQNNFNRLYHSNDEESHISFTTTELYVRPKEYVVIPTRSRATERPVMQPSKVGPGHAPCLDYETQPVYFLSYKATDDNGNGQSTLTSIRISLEDANDSPPVCESPLYRASLDEGAQSFDPPLIVKARDADSISKISYRILGSDLVASSFRIDKQTGELFIKETSDLDVNHIMSDFISFSVEADDGLFSAICHVNITIRDVNNHAPQFSRDHYLTSIAENSPIGTTIEQLNATDLDTGTNAKIRYRIQQGGFDDFVIDQDTGLITVARKLDYDKRNNYRIELVAADLGIPSLSGTAILIVDIINSNDKDPYFTPATQRTEIREDAKIGTRIHQLSADDPDIISIHALTFEATEPITAVNKNGKEITNTDAFKNLFAVDRYGNVTVNAILDRDLFAVVRLTVLVTDTSAPILQQGRGLLVITIIEVNELPPVFALPWTPTSPRLTFQMLEEQSTGTVLTTLQATDADSNIEEYHLSENEYFEINNLTGVIRTKSRIDYESIRQILFNAYVTDTGIPQLTSTAEIVVDIINTNDNDPIFKLNEYKMNVLENSPKATVVGKVEATDNDDGLFGDITYSLIGDQSKHFDITPDTGVITVENSTFLDRERVTEASFSVIASDKAPITTRRSTIVPITINIQDVNDNKPIFTNKYYHVSVAENAQLHPPAAVLQVNALDADEGIYGEVKYAVIANDNTLFQLDPNSGILYPSVSLKEKEGRYRITVEARDGLGFGPHADQAEIMIDVLGINNYRPVFIMPALSNASVEIQENQANENYLVMTVKATDNDTGINGKIKYHLQVDNQNVQETEDFAIDENTGELRIKRKLDRKKQSMYELVLVARDQGIPSWFETLRFLTILLVNVNENKPEFPDASNPYKFFITENGQRGVRIGKIQAFIPDKPSGVGIYYYILLGNENGAFYVDKTSGDVYTNRSLDREEVDTYRLFILASKKSDLHISPKDRHGFSIKSLERDSTVAKVDVKVLDLNDNPPKFEQDVYYAGVSAKASISELVTVVNASDADMGVNGTFELVITASNLYKFGSSKSVGSIVPSPFTISRDGRITTATYMGEYDQDRFELTIMAKESEAPEREAEAKVIVWVYRPDQLVRVILSRPPNEVSEEKEEIVGELQNATRKRIIVDEIRHHVNSMGQIRMDWCDLFFHSVDPATNSIVPVDDTLKVIDAHYDFLKDYYAGFAIENVVPAHQAYVEEEFDLAVAGLVSLLVVLFVGAISFMVLCCCLKNWNITIPTDTRRKEALIKKQFVDELSTTENPLWIEQKLKLYEEQELSMQVFSEPEGTQIGNINNALQATLGRRDSYEASHAGDNTYATILPRNVSQSMSNSEGNNTIRGAGASGNGISTITTANSEIADYATLRNNSRAPSTLYEFTGSTFQALQPNPDGNYVAEII